MSDDAVRTPTPPTSAGGSRPAAEFFEHIISEINVDLAVFDSELRYEYVNPVAIRDPEVRRWIVGKTDAEYVRHRGKDPAIAERRMVAMRAAIAARNATEFEEVLVRPTGERQYFVRRLCPILGPDGEVTKIIGYGFDVTQLRRADEAARESEWALREVIENAPHGIFRASAAGRLLVVNDALVRMLGYGTRHEVLNLTLPDDIYADREEYVRLIDEGMINGRLEGRGKWRRRDGTGLTVRVSGRPVYGEAGSLSHWECFAEDVTLLDEVEGALRDREEQLRQAQKMEAIGRMAGGIAHDFNNVLTAIRGNCELLLQELTVGHPSRREVEEISKASGRAADLTRQLLAFGRKQVLQPRAVDLNGAVRDMEHMVRRLVGETVQVGLDLNGTVGPVWADPSQLAQVLINLVVNARDAMPRGGRLTIATRNASDGTANDGRPFVVFSVSDTGQGISDAARPHIFEPFFTTKEQGRGTGLGLSTAYGIVEQTGGFIRFESRAGEGTRFDVYLPQADRQAVVAKETTPQAVPDPGYETILLAEDEESVRSLAERILERAGYKVLSAPDASHAMTLFQRNSGAVDLLVTDVVMPGMGGRELAERVRASNPNIQVLFMSGYHEDELLRAGVESQDGWAQGAFLAKPFSAAELLRAVREAIVAVGGPFQRVTGSGQRETINGNGS